MENKDEMNRQNQDSQEIPLSEENIQVESGTVVEEIETEPVDGGPAVENSESEPAADATVEEEAGAVPVEEEVSAGESAVSPEGFHNPEDPPNVGMGYTAAEELKAEVKKVPMDKRKILEIAGGAVIVVLLIVLGVTLSQKSALQKEYDDLSRQNSELQADYSILEKGSKTKQQTIDSLTGEKEKMAAEIEELKNGAAKQLVDVKNAYEKGDWNEVIKLAKALHDKYNGKEEDKEAQALAAESQKKLDEAKAAKEAEEAKGYETGITYDQLSRTPDDFKGKKVKFYGKVVQVIEGGSTIQIRLAVNDDYDTILLGSYSSSIVSRRVLEDDHITIYGTSKGTISYESTLGATITIPGVSIDKIDQ